MRRTINALLLVAAMMPLALAAQSYECTITIGWANVAGIGWSGYDLGGNRPSVLKLYQNDVLLDTLSPTTGHSGTDTFTVASDVPLVLKWGEGDFDVNNSFSIYAANGMMIYQCVSATFGDGATVAVISDPCGTCWPAQGLHVDSLGHDAVRLAWHPTAQAYQLVQGDYGFSPEYGNVHELTDTTLLIEDLEPGMRYDVYLYAVCSGALLDPVRLTFTTAGLPIDQYPYFTGFEADDDVGWGVSSNTNQWTIGGAATAEGDFGLYISNDGGQSNGYTDVPTLAYAYRTFVLDEPSLYNFSFNWRAVGDAWSDYLRVFLVPDSLANFEADVFPGTVTNFMSFRNSVPSGWIDFNSSTPRFYSGQSEWQTKQATYNVTEANTGTYRLLFLWCNNQNENFPTAAAIDNVSVSRNTCPVPTGFVADSVAEDALHLSWTMGGTEGSWQLSMDGGEWETVEGDPQHLVSGLPAGSTHVFRLRAYCSADDQSLYTTLTATTACSDSIRELPYTDNFEAYSAYVSSAQPGGNNPCWTRGYTGTSGGYPYVKSSNGNHFLYFYGTGLFAGNDYHSYAIFPPLALDITELELTFDLARSAENHDDTLIVALASSASASADMDTVAILTATSNNFVRQRVQFTDYAGSNRHLALIAPRCYFNESLISNAPCVDNINLHYIPDCTEPDSLALVSATETELTLAWVDAPTARVNYIVEYRQHGANEWIEYDSPTLPTATIQDLEAGTFYDVQVRSYCALGDTSFAIVNTFRTQCATIDTFPYIEQFSTAAALDCWTLLDIDNDGSTWSVNTSTGELASSYSNTHFTDDWAITPAIKIPEEADGYMLSFNIYGTYSYYQLLLSTTGEDTASFTTVLFDEDLSGSYATRRVSLDPYAGQTIHLAFRHSTYGDIGLRVDNFSIQLVQAPTVAISGPTAAGVDSTATFLPVLIEGAVEGLSYEWYSTMYNAGLAEMDIDPTSGSMSITYSAIGTDTITLSAVNNYGTATAQYIVQVYDMQPITELPYLTGFEAGDDRSWQVKGGANNWTIGNATRRYGSSSLYISSNGGATAGYSTTNASVSYAFRTIVLNASDLYRISFNWKAEGEGTLGGDVYDYLRVFITPASETYTANVLPDYYEETGDFAYMVPEGWIDLNGEMPLVDQNNWGTLDTSIAVDSSGLYNLLFLWVNDGEDGSGNAAAIDNVLIALITCPPVSDIQLDSVSPESISLHWTAGGGESQWIITANGSSQVATTTHATISGLNEATHYDISIRAICGEGDTSTPTIVTYATGADCSPRELPWSENFDTWGKGYTENYMHPCWERYAKIGTLFSSDNSVIEHGYVCSDTNHSTSGALMMYSSGANSPFWPVSFHTVAALPEFTLPANTVGVSISLSALFFALDDDVDHLYVGHLAFDGNTYNFVPAATINNTHSHEYEEHTIEMPNYKPADGRLALQYAFDRDGDFYYVAIEDISVTALGNPMPEEPEEPIDTTGISAVHTAIAASLSPNPATTSATLTTAEPASVTLFDIDGRAHGTWQTAGENLTLNLNGMARGTYFVRVVTASGSTTLKLSVQ